MVKPHKPPVIVAELGRPETASETAARKAHDSHMYRQRKTVNNLVFSLIVSLGVMLVIVLMAPGLTARKDTTHDYQVDVTSLATSATAEANRLLTAPTVPDTWKAKQATLSTHDNVTSWRINYTTGDNAYAAVIQAFTRDHTKLDQQWVSQQLEHNTPTSTEIMKNTQWKVYEYPEHSSDTTNVRFGLEGTVTAADQNKSTILVFGTDNAGTLRVLANNVVTSLTHPHTPNNYSTNSATNHKNTTKGTP